ncbi:capsule biosynthesis protein [Gimibacter soli]|uniref:Capsular biosynthesis protein n=1 Tax=Gimibacter soli TaxID=3024400 RepID=A0AAE9XQ31_9PROT|nr:capsular biosynthesis protein [Gimibacter soli]WCL55107.1 capsular biosynthesis protein [Gimibacter soli]
MTTPAPRRILLLQGPLGPFTAYLIAELRKSGAEVFRLNLNGGDALYGGFFGGYEVAAPYRGRAEDWPDFLTRFLADNRIGTVVAYGDCRFYHRVAREICAAQDLRFFGLEEGYIRPGYVTLEEGGNNGNSRFPERFAAGETSAADMPAPDAGPSTFWSQAGYAYRYYGGKFFRGDLFPHYVHHRPGAWPYEVYCWGMAALRKQIYRRSDARLEARLHSDLSGRFFLVPLQVAIDAQVLYHSDFASVGAFVETVVASFAQHAGRDDHLVLKHHPMDRGFSHYGRLIRRLIRAHGLEGRVHYCFDLDLDRLWPHVKGCVTINSTVGFSALKAGVPTVALGRSMMAVPGMAQTGGLDTFWTSQLKVESGAVQAFVSHLIAETQVPGSFYRRDNVTAARVAAKLLAD